MRLKSFHANTVTEAMKMIRDSLGEDAIIVATREEGAGKGVRVTAAVDEQDYQDLSQTDFNEYEREETEKGYLQYDDEEEDGGVAETLTEVMLKHSVPEEIIDQIVSCATVVGLEQAHIALVAALEHLFSFRPLSQTPVNKAYMLVGPPGSGKTLTAAKLAARSTMAGHKVAVITTDTMRAGGLEQLAAFTKILGVSLSKAKNAAELKTWIDANRAADFKIIDTGGFNPFRADEMRDLARLISAGDIEPILVMPAGADAEEAGEIARIYASVGVRHILPTRLDIGRRLGGLLSAAHFGGLIFAEASDTPSVAEGLFDLSPDRLANLLMPQVSNNKSQQGRDSNANRALNKRIVNAG
ncbi:MAG: SRP54-type, GTPase domain protein [Micavibrio sp.]|nr:SRP54-type, GTPase domain protein [Micavibrio sp.]